MDFLLFELSLLYSMNCSCFLSKLVLVNNIFSSLQLNWATLIQTNTQTGICQNSDLSPVRTKSLKKKLLNITKIIGRSKVKSFQRN